MGEQHANGWRVSRHRLVADVTVGVIANPMSGRDIRRLVASASVFPNAEKASMDLTLPRRHRLEAEHARLAPLALKQQLDTVVMQLERFRRRPRFAQPTTTAV